MVLANAEAAGLTVSVSLDGAWMTATDDSLMSSRCPILSRAASTCAEGIRYEVRVKETR